MVNEKELLEEKRDKEWYKKVGLKQSYQIVREDHFSRLKLSLKKKLINLDSAIQDKAAIMKRIDYLDTKRVFNIEHYPILPSQTRVLIGELTTRPYAFTVNSYSIENIEERNRLMGERFNTILNGLVNKSKNQLVSEISEVKENPPRTNKELMVESILTVLLNKLNINEISESFFRNFIITGEAFSKITDDLKIDAASIDTYVSGDVLMKDVKKANGIVEIDYISVNTALSKYKLDIDSRNRLIDQVNADVMLDGMWDNPELDAHSPTIGNLIRRITVIFKGYKKIKMLTGFENGVPVERPVSYYYTADKTKGEVTKIRTISQWYKCVFIGNDELVDYGPIPSTHIFKNGTIESVLPYVFKLNRSDYGSVSSLYSMAYRYSELYDIIFYLTEDLIKKNRGKVMIYDSASSGGLGVRQTLDLLSKYNVKVINTAGGKSEAYLKGFAPSPQNTVHGAVDLDISASLPYYIGLLDFLESKIKSMTGFNDQRMGAIKPSELVGNVNAAMGQSSMNTEPWFKIHYSFMSELLTSLLVMSKRVDSDVLYSYGLTTQQIDFINNELNDTYVANIVNNPKDLDIGLKIDGFFTQQMYSNTVDVAWGARILTARSYKEKLELIRQMKAEANLANENNQKFEQMKLQEEFARKMQELEAQLTMDSKIKMELMEKNHQLELEKLVKEITSREKISMDLNEFKLKLQEMIDETQLELKRMDGEIKKSTAKKV